MHTHRIHLPANARHNLTSSQWIAHNAAMADKRELLGHGARPRIGARYRPAIVRTPAITKYRYRMTVRDKACAVLMLIGLVAVLYGFATIGSAVGLQ